MVETRAALCLPAAHCRPATTIGHHCAIASHIGRICYAAAQSPPSLAFNLWHHLIGIDLIMSSRYQFMSWAIVFDTATPGPRLTVWHGHDVHYMIRICHVQNEIAYHAFWEITCRLQMRFERVTW